MHVFCLTQRERERERESEIVYDLPLKLYNSSPQPCLTKRSFELVTWQPRPKSSWTAGRPGNTVSKAHVCSDSWSALQPSAPSVCVYFNQPLVVILLWHLCRKGVNKTRLLSLERSAYKIGLWLASEKNWILGVFPRFHN